MAMSTGGGGGALVRDQCYAHDRHSSGAVDHLHGHRAGDAKGLDALVPQPPKDPQQQQQPNDRTIVVQVLYRPGAAPTYKINETDVQQDRLAAAG